MNKQYLLILGGILLLIGLLRPDFSNLLNNNSVNHEMSIPKPSNVELLDECEQVTLALKNGNPLEAKRLASLYLDLASLIALDGDDLVVKNTEEIRQANSLSGVMLKLDIKGKYPKLAESAKSVIVAAIGDDNVPLTKDLRDKASEGFRALAWACNEGAK